MRCGISLDIPLIYNYTVTRMQIVNGTTFTKRIYAKLNVEIEIKVDRRLN